MAAPPSSDSFFGVILGIPAVMAEWTLGRHTRQGPAGAFVTAGMPGGRAIGILLFVTVYMATSYYTLVVGQVLFYALETFLGGAAGDAPAEFFATHLTGITGWNLSVTAVTFLAMAGVLYMGVRGGIESVSRIVVPVVFVSLLVVILRSVTLPGASEGIRFFLLPDLAKVNAQTVLAALGQVFFSLSLGGTFFLLYGSYLREDEDIPRMAVMTAIGDLGAALLGGLAILPAVFAMGLAPTSGPSLLFITLPGVFAAMPGGLLRGRDLLCSTVSRGVSIRRRGHAGARRQPRPLLRLESGEISSAARCHQFRRGDSLDGELQLSHVERLDLGIDDAAHWERPDTRRIGLVH